MSRARIKIIYVLLYMAFATWRVYYNLYLEENQFSGIQIGTINALFQAAVFIIVPFWGVFADRRGIRPTLRLVVFASGLLLLFLGNILNFWMLLIYIIVLTIFHHPVGPLIDALAVQYSQINKKSSYGSLRLWGSLGWAIASIITGFLFKNYLGIDKIFLSSALLFLFAIFFLGIPGRSNGVKYRPHFERIHLSEVSANKPLLFFLVILFLYGIASSPINAYMNLYLAELGADTDMIGIGYTIQSLSELPFFIIGNRLVKKWGAIRVILISMVIMVIRYFIYAAFPVISLALIACVLQGITLSFLLVGVVDYLHGQLPPNRHATAQSLLWGLYFGLGHTFGNFIIGLLKDSHGMIGVMKVFLGITLFTLLLTAIDFFSKKSAKLSDLPND